MVLQITIEAEDLPKELIRGATRRIIVEESIRTVNETSTIIRNGMVEVSPVGGTRTLRTSWIVQPARATSIGVVGGVGTSAIQALVLDEGAVPHSPPTRPGLELWVRRVLGESDPRKITRTAHKIRGAIRRRGLPGRASRKGIFSKKFRALGGVIAVLMGQMADGITRRISG